MKRVAFRVACLLTLGSFGGACVIVFPEYDLENAGAGGAGGVGGASAEGGGGASTSTSMLAPDGAPCTDSVECSSGQCVASSAGSGDICCAAKCAPEEVATCGMTGQCEPDGAACAVYPENTPCGDLTVCEDAFLTTQQCVGGACAPVTEPCHNGLACESSGPMSSTACKSQCMNPFLDCAAPNAMCMGNACTVGIGAECHQDGECVSGICGTQGFGHCCAAGTSCAIGGVCGADDCDTTGACHYPSAATVCGDMQSCDGFQLATTYCDGMGSCEVTPEEQPCAGGFTCLDSTTCRDTCSSNDNMGDLECAASHWCDGEACIEDFVGIHLCGRPSQCASGNCLILCL